jgi:hypothetical protein
MQNKILFFIFLFLTNLFLINNYKIDLNNLYFLSNNTIWHSDINIKYSNNQLNLNKLSILLNNTHCARSLQDNNIKYCNNNKLDLNKLYFLFNNTQYYKY